MQNDACRPIDAGAWVARLAGPHRIGCDQARARARIIYSQVDGIDATHA